ncbi:hydrolase [Mycobacterium tuberculosis]|nr:hydrolase [Mycobacterium tuberculosis]
MDVDLPPPGPLTSGGLRVTALGGINEIGRNMTVFEHLGRLLIIDCGVLFPGHDEPGVDLILPTCAMSKTGLTTSRRWC